MVAESFVQDPQIRKWLDGVEPAWTLLTFDSLRALRQEPSAAQTAIRIANDLSVGETAASPVARNTLILLRQAIERVGLPLTATGNLSRAVVAEMCQLLEWPDYDQADAFRFNKVINEPDFLPLHAVRQLAQAATLVRAQRKKLVATPLGKSILSDARQGSLLAILFHLVFWHMDLGYFGHGLLGSWTQRDAGVVLWSLSVTLSGHRPRTGFDAQRSSAGQFCCDAQRCPLVRLSPCETARFHHAARRRGGCVAARGAGATARPNAAGQRADGMVGGKSGIPHLVRGIRPGTRRIRLGRRTQVRIDVHWTSADINRARTLAKELVDRQPDVILAGTTPVTAALLNEMHTIPIVFAVVSDPVGAGFVGSLPRPGGNVTGFINEEGAMGGKWLALLQEVAPRFRRAAIMFNPDTAPGGGTYFLGSFEAAAQAMIVEPIVARVRSDAEIESAIAALGQENAALVVMTDSFMGVHRGTIIRAALRHKVPTIYDAVVFAREGGLLAYGSSNADSFRRSADYVDRILRGAKPANLPVQVPVKYELAINLKTAKSLGLEVPLFFQQRADEVIE